MTEVEVPCRDNSGHQCELVERRDPHLPDHIMPCACDEHHGVCASCNFKITVGPNRVEYGHARSTNKGPRSKGGRDDCPHRPTGVDPTGNDSTPGGRA